MAPAPLCTSPVASQPDFNNYSESLRKTLGRRSQSKSRSSNVTDRTSALNGYPEITSGRMRSAYSQSLPFKTRFHDNSPTMKRTSKSARSSYLRKNAILDKRSVFQKYNDYIHEDVEWIVAQESTGSLCIMPPKIGGCDPRRLWDRERICKGSVARKIFLNKDGPNPSLSVNGNKDTLKYSESKRYPQNSRNYYKQKIPELTRNDTVEEKTDFQHVIPTMEKMNLRDSQNQQTTYPPL